MSQAAAAETVTAADKLKAAAQRRKQRLGEVVSVNGSHALVMLDEDRPDLDRVHRPQLGAILSIDTGACIVLGLVSAMSVPAPSLDSAGKDLRIIELELIGEFTKPTQKTPARFRRGVSTYPTLHDEVQLAAREELAALFAANGSASIRIGVVKQDVAIPATVSVNELFSRHCAILGTTGAGKSCAITLMLSAVLQRYRNGHVVILDPHNEYSHCFGQDAVVFDTSSLTLPFWMLTFEELVEILYPGRVNCAEEIEILADIIPQAKRMNIGAAASGAKLMADRRDAATITVDTPIPYRISELLTLIDKTLGSLENARATCPYKRLRARLH
ncbi:MAG: DUF87 domain-containing protein, partial [Parvularculaceae bacterium]|nr:DUF87 domain-containing protein [Parvularculaceae bacterium]